MKKLYVLTAALLFTFLFCLFAAGPISVRAEGEITTEATTVETTTEEPVTTTVPIGDIDIAIVGEEIIISIPGQDDIVLSKAQAITFLTEIIQENFGPVLTTFGISAGVLAVIIVALICFALKYLVQYVKGQRAALLVSQSKVNSESQVVTTLAENTARTLRAEKRAMKAEAYGAIATKGIMALLANSTIEQNAIVGSTYQKDLDAVNKLDDDVSEADLKVAVSKIVKEATDQVKNTVVGTAAKVLKAKKSALIASLQAADGK